VTSIGGLSEDNDEHHSLGEHVVPERPPLGVCVLVVEDNMAIGDFVVQALDELGYGSRLMVNAEEALKVLASNGASIDVIFSDVVMPGMSGLELGENIWRMYPHIPVVLTSGHSKVVDEHGPHGFELLQKPYTIDQLRRVLSKALSFGRSTHI
jgi:DNA-binding NtrC family response regulator